MQTRPARRGGSFAAPLTGYAAPDPRQFPCRTCRVAENVHMSERDATSAD